MFIDTTLVSAVSQYNRWAADKPLAKDVIIHTHPVHDDKLSIGKLIIVVFFDEKMHPDW
jgi:hypothetical protein